MRYIVAITGASGSILGVRLVGELLKVYEVYLTVTKESFFILKDEAGIDWEAKTEKEIEEKIQGYFKSDRLRYFDDNNMKAPIASGSFKTDGMVIIPCTMKTLSGIANGYAASLIERAADVMLKEGRTLIIVPRETPFSAIHLRNMLRLAEIGVKIIPPIPAFYHKPKSIDDMIDFIIGRVLDNLGIDNEIYKRWGERRIR